MTHRSRTFFVLSLIFLTGIRPVFGGAILFSAETSRTVSTNVPLESRLFGFNVPWHNFQRGHLLNGGPSPQIRELLKPFRGAFYRFPGGDESNIYDWRKAVGPGYARRNVMTLNSGMQYPQFGIQEFLDFVGSVQGIPLFTVNLCGATADCKESDAVASARDLAVQYGREAGSDGEMVCDVDRPCRIAYWELGNELDLGRTRWSSDRYARSARTVAAAIRDVHRTSIVVAATATAPWSEQVRAERPEEFTRGVAHEIDSAVDGYAFHAYYDGLAVPRMQSYYERALNALRNGRQSFETPDLYITEHARWPNRPLIGSWETAWATTKDLGAALSVGDYLLTIAGRPEIKAAMIHALGTWGPWQIITSPDEGKTLIPTPLYWGLRVLREGLQGNLVAGPIADVDSSAYRGGYGIKAVISRRADGSHVLVAINRSRRVGTITVGDEFDMGSGVEARLFQVKGTSEAQMNTVDYPRNIEMAVSLVEGRRHSNGVEFSVPPLSLSAFELNPKGGGF